VCELIESLAVRGPPPRRSPGRASVKAWRKAFQALLAACAAAPILFIQHLQAQLEHQAARCSNRWAPRTRKLAAPGLEAMGLERTLALAALSSGAGRHVHQQEITTGDQGRSQVASTAQQVTIPRLAVVQAAMRSKNRNERSDSNRQGKARRDVWHSSAKRSSRDIVK